MRVSAKAFTLFITICTFVVFAPNPPSVEAQSGNMDQLVQKNIPEIEKIAQSSLVVKAVKDQNSKYMSLEEIQRIDQEWIAGGQSEFAESLQKNDTAMYLKISIQRKGYLYTEAFLCDRNGAVVAEYPKTSDYWQGDEEKFTACFNDGYGKVFVGEPEFDESTQSTNIQVSVPVEDEGRTIGVLVMGLRSY